MKKGVILAIVIGIMFVISALALAALYLMTQESRIAEHKIRRMRVYYAARAGMVHALESLRRGSLAPGGTADIAIGAGYQGYPTAGVEVDIEVGELISAPGEITDGTYQVDVTASYQ